MASLPVPAGQSFASKKIGCSSCGEVIAERQGCLVAQTMGLGKTMKVVILLVSIAEAVRSANRKLVGRIPNVDTKKI